MCTLLEQVVVKSAKKRHACDAWHFIDEDTSILVDLDVGYKCKGIQAGDSYERSRIVDNGDAWTFKGCSPCLKIINDYDIDITGGC